MAVLFCVALIFGYIYEDSDSLIVYDDTLTICGHHLYNLKIHIADESRLMIRPWAGSDSTGWLFLSAPDICVQGLSMICGDGAGYWGGTNTHANGYGAGYGVAGNLGGGAGGGGGYGGTGGDGGGIPGFGGIAYGNSSDTIIQMGSGGGAGRLGGVEGFGGNGGASIYFNANTLIIDSSMITVTGTIGYDAVIVAGGGGSGGGIMMWGDTVVLGAAILGLDGGPGGNTDQYDGYGGGGAGGGRLKIFYSSSIDTSNLEITRQGGGAGIGGWSNGQPGMPGSVHIGQQTGILEIMSRVDQTLVIQPNPTLGIIHVRTARAPIEVHVYDCTGREVRTINLATEDHIADLRGLKPGVYFLKSQDFGDLINKLIIAR